MGLFTRNKRKKEDALDKIWLNDRWYIDIRSKPYMLFDSRGMILNGQIHPVGQCCRHALGTDGFCNECWERFIQAGMKTMRRKT